MSCQSRLLAANLHWCTGQFACCECIISCRHESNNVVARNDITTPTVQRKMGQLCPGIKNWSHRSVCSDLILFQKMYCFYMHLSMLPWHTHLWKYWDHTSKMWLRQQVTNRDDSYQYMYSTIACIMYDGLSLSVDEILWLSKDRKTGMCAPSAVYNLKDSTHFQSSLRSSFLNEYILLYLRQNWYTLVAYLE